MKFTNKTDYSITVKTEESYDGVKTIILAPGESKDIEKGRITLQAFHNGEKVFERHKIEAFRNNLITDDGIVNAWGGALTAGNVVGHGLLWGIHSLFMVAFSPIKLISHFSSSRTHRGKQSKKFWNNFYKFKAYEPVVNEIKFNMKISQAVSARQKQFDEIKKTQQQKQEASRQEVMSQNRYSLTSAFESKKETVSITKKRVKLSFIPTLSLDEDQRETTKEEQQTEYYRVISRPGS